MSFNIIGSDDKYYLLPFLLETAKFCFGRGVVFFTNVLYEIFLVSSEDRHCIKRYLIYTSDDRIRSRHLETRAHDNILI